MLGLAFRRSFVDGKSAVPCAACHRVEFQVLLEGLALAGAIHKALFLVVHSQVVEGWHAEDGEGEWDGGQSEFAGVVSAGEGSSQDGQAEEVV